MHGVYWKMLVSKALPLGWRAQYYHAQAEKQNNSGCAIMKDVKQEIYDLLGLYGMYFECLTELYPYSSSESLGYMAQASLTAYFDLLKARHDTFGPALAPITFDVSILRPHLHSLKNTNHY